MVIEPFYIQSPKQPAPPALRAQFVSYQSLNPYQSVIDRLVSRWECEWFPPEPTLTLKERFIQLSTKWRQETGHSSSIEDMTSNPSYQEIINLGWDVVPLLLDDLQRNNGFWFPALYDITKIRPFDTSDAGNSRRMTKAWIKWGVRKGII
jgi:hypothetical protein